MGTFASKSTQKSADNSQIIPSRNRLSKPNRLRSENQLSTFKSPTLVQAKLTHNQEIDKYEQETIRSHGFLSDKEPPPLRPERERPVFIGQNGEGTAPGTEAAPETEPATLTTDTEAETPADEERPATETCAITSRTTVHAPDRTPDTRTKIGVCETIEFTLGGREVDWTANTGWPRARRGRARFLWAAPERSGTSTITATIPDAVNSCSIDMTVVAPSSIRMRRQSVLAGPAAGAGMRAVVRTFPRNVNFGWVAIREDPGPASNVTGYFAGFPAASLFHHPNPDFIRLGWNNNLCCDTAATFGNPPPWSEGGFRWVIPTRYRCFNSTGNGRIFTHMVQRFQMDAAGGVTVSKQGATVP